MKRLMGFVTEEVMPRKLGLLTADNGCLRLLVVSERFRGMTLANRAHWLATLFEKKGRVLAENYTLVFKAMTQSEYEQSRPDLPKKTVLRRPYREGSVVSFSYMRHLRKPSLYDPPPRNKDEIIDFNLSASGSSVISHR